MGNMLSRKARDVSFSPGRVKPFNIQILLEESTKATECKIIFKLVPIQKIKMFLFFRNFFWTETA